MRYMGSKARLAKYILPIMTRYAVGRTWVEPFMGACGMLDKVGFCNRIGADINPYIVALYDGVVNGWVPPESISRELYCEIKNNKEHFDQRLVGFVGFGCSFGGKFFGGFASDKNGTNYALQSKNSLLEQGKRLKGCKFLCGDYSGINIPPESLVYCDPPYKDATNYSGGFNHDKFWSWCAKMSKSGHTVFVSEYSAPAAQNILCVYERKVLTLLNKNEPKSRYERLYLVKC